MQNLHHTEVSSIEYKDEGFILEKYVKRNYVHKFGWIRNFRIINKIFLLSKDSVELADI